ncbi:MAG: hypothetical protein ACHQM4_03760 [Thermoanaerobaculia bacterium]
MEGRSGAVLKAVVIALVAWFAVDRFLPWIPLTFIAHEAAPLPNALKEPIQGERSGEAFSVTRRGRSFRVVPRASYDVAARVASTERYRAGLSGDLLPWDFALAWGATTSGPAWPHISYVQTGRFYNWSTHDRALDPGYVSSHTANTHLIAATGRIASVFGLVHRGDLVRLEGDLVDVDGPDGFVWRTSLTRADTGPGACETLYVRAITIGRRRYH